LQAAGWETICVTRDIEGWGERPLAAPALMQHTFAAIAESDLVIVELSEKGVGLGIEAGYAYACQIRSERFTQMFPFGTFFLLHRIANATSPQASLPAELAVVVSRFVFETTKWVRSYPQYRLGFRH
jgi:hypothetical protein